MNHDNTETTFTDAEALELARCSMSPKVAEAVRMFLTLPPHLRAVAAASIQAHLARRTARH